MEKHDTRLSENVKIKDYYEFVKRKDREQIADFIQARFTERYITPLKKTPKKRKHGFTTMAISCLLIETLESFHQGLPDTKSKSKKIFNQFFQRCTNLGNNLEVFCKYGDDFYDNVRCGILHQAETRKGWRIRRKGPLFDKKTKTINATLFHEELDFVLKGYCGLLRKAEWDDEVWVNLRKKMDSIIKGCK